MPTKQKIKKLRRLLFLSIILLIIFPTIFMVLENVNANYNKNKMDLSTEKNVTINFDRKISRAYFLVTFYDNNGNVLESVEVGSDNLNSNVYSFEAKTTKVGAISFKIEELAIYSENYILLTNLTTILEALCFLLWIITFRINMLELNYNNHVIYLYSGVRDHKIFIDEKEVKKVQKILFVKDIKIIQDIDDNNFVVAEISPSKKLKLSLNSKQESAQNLQSEETLNEQKIKDIQNNESGEKKKRKITTKKANLSKDEKLKPKTSASKTQKKPSSKSVKKSDNEKVKTQNAPKKTHKTKTVKAKDIEVK